MNYVTIHRVPGDLDGNADRFLRASGSPRPQGARDDKRGMVRSVCHCEEGTQVNDAAIHRVLRGRGRVCLFVYWFTVDRHGLRPRDDKVEYAVRLVRASGSPRPQGARDDKRGMVRSVCHCEEGTQVTDAAIHRV